MVIKGSIDYEIEISDEGYQIKFDRRDNNELAALMIARENVKFSKAHLKKNIPKQGSLKQMVNDRINKAGSGEYFLSLMIEATLVHAIAQSKQEKPNEKTEEIEKSNSQGDVNL